MSDPKDWNRHIIDEFRANDGKVGGPFEGAPLLLLHTIGARTGVERVNPTMYRDLGGPLAVFASKAGAPDNPDWYHNLLANPDVSAEIGTETRHFRARTTTGDERQHIWDEQKRDYPGFRRLRGEDRSGDPRRHPRSDLTLRLDRRIERRVHWPEGRMGS